jgi:hypothetical protein
LAKDTVYKIVLDRAFFLICGVSIFFGFSVEKFEKNGPSEVKFLFFEIGHIGYKKNRELYADFKNANLS